MSNKCVVDILSTETAVTASCQGGEAIWFDIQDGNIKGTATEVKYEDASLRWLILVLVAKTASDCSGGRLVENIEAIELSQGASLLSRTSLLIIEVRRDCHNTFGHISTDFVLRTFLKLGQHLSRNLFRVQCLNSLLFGFDLEKGAARPSLLDDLEWP